MNQNLEDRFHKAFNGPLSTGDGNHGYTVRRQASFHGSLGDAGRLNRDPSQGVTGFLEQACIVLEQGAPEILYILLAEAGHSSPTPPIEISSPWRPSTAPG